MNTAHRFKNYFLAFLEGSLVLAVELLGGKIISAYYGSSLFVWTSVIGITLIGLTSGYYAGGYISTKKNPADWLFHILLLAGCSIASVPFYSHSVLLFTSDFDILIGAFIASACILIPSLFFLGCITPLLIKVITTELSVSGKSSGIIYGLTTVGGIITTYLLGFFIVPKWGISIPLIFFSLLVSYYAVFYFFSFSKIVYIVIYLFVLAALNIKTYGKTTRTVNPEKRGPVVIYQEEGMLGQLKVVDLYEEKMFSLSRRLMINGIGQTWMLMDENKSSLWAYPHIVSCIASVYPRGSKALVLGIGGGSVVKELNQLGHAVDAVDIDIRMYELAKNYFFLDSTKSTFYVDDARHFIKKCNKKYDIVMLDLLSGEVQPSYLFSLESFKEIKKLLSPQSRLIINYQGDPKGIAGSSIYKTLLTAGYYCNYSVNGSETGEESLVSDIIISASLSPFELGNFNPDRLNTCCFKYARNFLNRPSRKDLIDMGKGRVLYDDLPILEHLNKNSILAYRKSQSRFLLQEQKQGSNDIFY